MSKRTEDNKWQHWQNKLLEILGITHEQLARGATPTTPWFLVPQDELPEDLTADLFLTVRQYLLGPTLAEPIPYAIERIRRLRRRLRPTESLPLLYAMRHVARAQGSIGRYWPVFHSEILAERLNLDDIRVRLAPALERVWIWLFIHTRGALYYPSEGRRFIKWPLAHAGLLSDDEEVLRVFGGQLVSEYGDSLSDAPLLPDELDEFLQFFLEWLQGGGQQFRASQLGRLLRRSDGSDVTVGELAQQWTREHWTEIAARQDGSVTVRTPTHLRPSLRYDPVQQRVLVVLRESRWPGERDVIFRWGDVDFHGHARYVRDEGETICPPFEIPVLVSNWVRRGELLAGNRRHPVRMPRPPENYSFVFRADNGVAIRQWHLGEEYYVLIAKQTFDSAVSDVVFGEWVPLGSPEGKWDDYELLWVRVRDPLQQTDASTFTSILAEFEKATGSLRLPSFGHLSSTRLYLFGGTRLGGPY